MNQIIIIICILLNMLLSSCSLKPVLAERSSLQILKTIEIADIDSPEGAELTHYLSQILPSFSSSLYRLEVSFETLSSPLAIHKDSSIVRQNLSLKIKYTLQQKSTGTILTSGEFNNITSYDTTFSPYTSYDESDSALLDMLKNSAHEIRNRLILFLSKNSA